MDFLDLSLNDQMKDSILSGIETLFRSGKYILADNVDALEKNLSYYLSSTYCVTVNSGYDALVLSLRACGVAPGDEVITVSNTFVATVNAIQSVGAIPVLIDVDETRNMDSRLIENAITSKTKVLLPVHLAGIPCDMDEIGRIADKHSLKIIEDAAQAFGSVWHGRHVGTFGQCGCFSLHPTKVFGACGDGGFVVTEDKNVYEQLMLFRNHGLANRDECLFFGQNSRLDEIQACILNVKLQYVCEEIRKRAEIAAVYADHLRCLPIECPVIAENTSVSFFTFTIQCDDRDSLKEYLAQNGIDTRIHYPSPIHFQHSYLNAYGRINLPVTEKQSKRILSLPCNGKLPMQYIHKTIDSIRGRYGK